MTCRSCGGVASGLVCAYCGALQGQISHADDEQRAVEEFHAILARTTGADARLRLLQSGFVPTHPAPLIDAALRCVPLLDNTMTADSPVASATYARLQILAAKLRVIATTPEVKRALAELAPHLAKQRNAQLWAGFTNVVIGLGIALVFGCAGIIWLAGALQ